MARVEARGVARYESVDFGVSAVDVEVDVEVEVAYTPEYSGVGPQGRKCEVSGVVPFWTPPTYVTMRHIWYGPWNSYGRNYFLYVEMV